MTEPQTWTPNQDGTFTINLDGKATKLVKESDLLAVKGASETARKEYESTQAKYQTDLAEANRVKDESHTQLVQERAAKELLEKDAQEGANLKTKVGELETTNATLEGSRSKLEEELTGMKRSTLVTQFKVDEAKVKEMNLDQLRQTESSLQLVGVGNPKPANYDGGSGGAGGGTAPTSVLEQAKEELKLAREIQQKKRAGTFDPDYKP